MYSLLILSILLTAAKLSEASGVFRKHLFHEETLHHDPKLGDPGSPLFLTPYIENKEIALARKLAEVGPLGSFNGTSYSGLFTVNKTYNSSMFVWYFPAQNKDETAPTLLWLQGGPGGSSLFGLFVENGPITIDEKLKATPKAITWNKKYNMVYIDNPVGTGFSFTKDPKGYSTNETQVADNLYSALTQFFTLFPELQKSDFYVTGESYAGKYIPAIVYKIHAMNIMLKEKHVVDATIIPLKGMAIGDGLCDPATMFDYGALLYAVGMADETQRDYVDSQCSQAKKLIDAKNFYKAFLIFDELLNGDIYKFPTYFYNITGTKFYFNFLLTEAPVEFSYFPKFLNLPAVRAAIHVGSLPYNDGLNVEKALLLDIMDSVKPLVVEILNAGYKSLFYSGQLDIIVGSILTENFLWSLPWKNLPDYQKAVRTYYKINPNDTEVAGYMRGPVHNLWQVIIRGGGHILPFDQPERAMDMIDRFISAKPSF